MKRALLKIFLCVCVTGVVVIACNRDDISDPYQPVTLPKIDRLDFVNGNDSSIFIYHTDKVLTSGRDNYIPGSGSGSMYEWFTMQYTGNGLLNGAVYDVASSPTDHKDFFQATFSRNNRNMLSKITREDSKMTVSLSYDDIKLTRITVTGDQVENRYTIEYSGENVSSVEIYRKVANVEGTTREDFSDYDTYPNPFYFLVNTFYAPAFASKYGPVRFDYIPLGFLLSANNPKTITKYAKNGNDWEKDGNSIYVYEYDDHHYPVSISGEGLSLTIKYYSLIP